MDSDSTSILLLFLCKLKNELNILNTQKFPHMNLNSLLAFLAFCLYYYTIFYYLDMGNESIKSLHKRKLY